MDYLYIVSKSDIKILDVKNVEDFSIGFDSEYGGKSTIRIGQKATIEEKDFAFLKHEDGSIFYAGIVDSITNESGHNEHTLNAIEIENLFDRTIFIGSEEVKRTVGIEDFIKNEIETNFSKSEDALLNLDYIEVEVLTHTPVLSSIDTESGGIYNFMTFLGNAREYYGIFLDFSFEEGKLKIAISKKDQPVFKFDSSVSDVDNYLEDYSVDVLAKLSVKWKIPDVEEDGVTTIGATTDLAYFLKVDRTITSDISDPDRATGSIECLYVEKETIEEVIEEVTNKFRGNAYEHSVTADVRIGSNIYPEDQFYVGHECEIKTKSHGVKKSLITKVEKSSDSSYISVKFGNMAITLIEKLRKEKRK